MAQVLRWHPRPACALWVLGVVALAGCAAAPLHSAPDAAGADPGRGPRAVEISTASGVRLRPEIKSWKTRRQENVVLQKYDYSCGAAALTTVLRYYFKDVEMTEQKVLEAVFKRLERLPDSNAVMEDRVKNGLSILDLQQTAADMGYQSAVANITWEQAHKLEAPVIVRIIKDEYKHFVVLRGFLAGRAFLADSVRGNVRLSEAEFAKQWNAETDATKPPKYVALFLGKEGFGLPKDHPLAVRPELLAQPELDAARRAIVAWPGPTR